MTTARPAASHTMPTPFFDRRLWYLLAAISFFGYIVLKEVQMSRSVILGLGGMGFFALLIAGLQGPEIPLYILVAYLPFSRVLVGDFGTQATAFNLTNVISIWVFMAYLIKQGAMRQPITQPTPMNRMLLLFSFMGGISLLRAGWEYGSYYWALQIISLKRWLTPIIFYFLTLWVVRDKMTIKTVMVLIMFAVTIVAFMAVWEYQFVASSSFEQSRIGGVVEQPNALGAFFVYYMFLMLGLFLMYPKNFKAWLLLLPFLLCFRGIMVTFSRGAYLAFAMGTASAMWFRSKVVLILMIAVGLFALSQPWMLPEGIRYRMGMTMVKGQAGVMQEDVTQSLEVSSANRIKIWRGAVQMIKEHPLWGVGYEAFPHFIGRYAEGHLGFADAHNSYLLIAAEMGIPTLLVFLMVLSMSAYYAFWLYQRTQDKWLKALALGFLAGLGALFTANMFGSRMDRQELSGYYYILLGLIMRAVIIERSPQARAEAAAAAPPKRKVIPKTGF